jgi:hypothetical protein
MQHSWWFLCAVTVLAWSGTGAQPADKNVEQAKKACETFAKGICAKDVPVLMKIVAVPWCDNLNLNASKLILKSDELKQRLERIINGAQQIPAKVVLDFKAVYTYEKVLEKSGAALAESERKIFDQVLKKTDYVLYVAIKSPEGETLTELSFLVGFHDGQAKVVGLRGG